MAPRNTNNPSVDASFSNCWPMKNLTVEGLAVIRVDYDIFCYTVCGLSHEEVLTAAQM